MRVIFLGCGYLGYNLSLRLKDSFTVELWGIDSPYVSRTDHFSVVDAFDPAAMAKMNVRDAVIVDTIALVSNDAKSDDDSLVLESLARKYRALLKVLQKGGAKRYVYLSSGGTIYGDSLEPISEGEPVRPMTLYAKSKSCIEEVLQDSGMDYLILRPANPYGGYQLTNKHQGVIPVLIEKAITGQPFEMWNNGSSIRDYFYIDDFARALGLLLQKDISREIVNIGSGEGTSLKTIIELVEQAVGKPIQIQHDISSVPVIQAIVLDISKLKELTGYQPSVSLKDGIQKEIERIKKEKGIQ